MTVIVRRVVWSNSPRRVNRVGRRGDVRPVALKRSRLRVPHLKWPNAHRNRPRCRPPYSFVGELTPPFRTFDRAFRTGVFAARRLAAALGAVAVAARWKIRNPGCTERQMASPLTSRGIDYLFFANNFSKLVDICPAGSFNVGRAAEKSARTVVPFATRVIALIMCTARCLPTVIFPLSW